MNNGIDFLGIEATYVTSPTIFATHNFFLKHAPPHIVSCDPSGKQIDKVECDIVGEFYSYIEQDGMYFVQAGEKTVLMIDDVGNMDNLSILASVRGRQIVSLHRCSEPGYLFFVSRDINGNIQITKYSYKSRKRMLQTNFWKANQCDVLVNDNDLFVIIDNSRVICLGVKDLKQKTTQIAHSKFNPGSAICNSGFVYSSDNCLHILSGQKSQAFEVPECELSGVGPINRDTLFLLGDNNQSIYRYNIKKHILHWKLEFPEAIKQAVIWIIQTPEKSTPMLTCRTESAVFHINIKLNRIVHTSTSLGVYDIRAADGYLIMNTVVAHSYIFPAIGEKGD